MKIKLLVAILLLKIVNINSMEVENSEEKLVDLPELIGILKSAPSDEFIEAWKLATGKVASLKAMAALVIEKNG